MTDEDQFVNTGNASIFVLMKKAIAAISFVLYFVATTGIVINSHYCMKKLVSVEFFGSKAEVCGKCGMDMHYASGCCHDETKVVKLDEDQQKIPLLVYEITAPDVIAVPLSDFVATDLSDVEQQRHFHNHSPPLLSAQDTYLQNNVFRI
jgi:hypothetical protein